MIDELEKALPVALPEAWASPLAANDADAGSRRSPVSRRGARAMDRFAYDPTTRVLRVEWSSGNVYEIDDVPAVVAEGLNEAKSKGRYFQDWIRDRYPHRKIP